MGHPGGEVLAQRHHPELGVAALAREVGIRQFQRRQSIQAFPSLARSAISRTRRSMSGVGTLAPRGKRMVPLLNS